MLHQLAVYLHRVGLCQPVYLPIEAAHGSKASTCSAS